MLLYLLLISFKSSPLVYFLWSTLFEICHYTHLAFLFYYVIYSHNTAKLMQVIIIYTLTTPPSALVSTSHLLPCLFAHPLLTSRRFYTNLWQLPSIFAARGTCQHLHAWDSTSLVLRSTLHAAWFSEAYIFSFPCPPRWFYFLRLFLFFLFFLGIHEACSQASHRATVF